MIELITSTTGKIDLEIGQDYPQGYKDGKEKGFKEGYTDGYSKGKEEGYDNGYSDGYSKGEEEGYEWGWSDGYDYGYSDGYDDADSGTDTEVEVEGELIYSVYVSGGFTHEDEIYVDIINPDKFIIVVEPYDEYSQGYIEYLEINGVELCYEKYLDGGVVYEYSVEGMNDYEGMRIVFSLDGMDGTDYMFYMTSKNE